MPKITHMIKIWPIDPSAISDRRSQRIKKTIEETITTDGRDGATVARVGRGETEALVVTDGVEVIVGSDGVGVTAGTDETEAIAVTKETGMPRRIDDMNEVETGAAVMSEAAQAVVGANAVPVPATAVTDAEEPAVTDPIEMIAGIEVAATTAIITAMAAVTSVMNASSGKTITETSNERIMRAHSTIYR